MRLQAISQALFMPRLLLLLLQELDHSKEGLKIMENLGQVAESFMPRSSQLLAMDSIRKIDGNDESRGKNC